MKRFRIIAAALMLLMLLMTAAAEDYVDLGDRFSDIPSYEYNGTTYYMKDRVNTTLVMCVNLNDDGMSAGTVELMLLLVIDDDAKTVTPIQLDPAMTVDWLEDGEETLTLGEIFSGAANADEGSIALIAALNALFPEDVIEHYALFDLRGLPVLDGIENDETNTTGEVLVDRLKAAKKAAEESGADDATDMLDSMSGYIITDMKSGAMMKVVDKVDRYDRPSRTYFPVLEPADENDTRVMGDMEAFEAIMIELYYETGSIW